MGKKKSDTGGPAVIYARYSSHNQRDVSIEQQIAACEKYAASGGYSVVGRYADRAVSGKTDKRPQFQLMMRDAKKGTFDYVIAWKSNRMGRNMLQAMVNESKLAEHGVKCLYVEEDFDDTAAGRFALRNMMNVNQFYSENMAEDIRRGLMDNAQKCKVNGKLPLGYRKGPDGEYVVDEAGAAIVREIFQRIVDGWTIFEIMADLNQRGVRTGTGGQWKKQSFDKLLQNENYIGVYRYSDVRIENGIPVIIPKDQFERVQVILKNKPNARGSGRLHSEYLLSGKVFCGLCGSPMTAQCGTARDGTKRDYYMCNRRRYEHACEKKTVPKEKLERRVAESVKLALQDDDLVEKIVCGYAAALAEAFDETQKLALQSELDDVNMRLKNILAAIEAGIFNEQTQARMQELTDSRKELEEALRLEEMANDFPTPDRIRFDLLEFRNGDLNDPEYMRNLIKTFVKAVYVYDDDGNGGGGYLRVQFYYGRESRIYTDDKATGNAPGDVVQESGAKPHHRIFLEPVFTISYFEIKIPFKW